MAIKSQLKLNQLTGSLIDIAFSGSLSSADDAGDYNLVDGDLAGVLGHMAGAIGRISGKTGVGASSFTNAPAGQFFQDLLLTSTNKVQFSDDAVFIHAPGDARLLAKSDGTFEIDAATTVKIDSDSGDISFEDNGVAQLAIDMDGTAGEIIMQLKVDSDDFVFKQFDGTEVFRVEDDGGFDIAGGAGSSGVTVSAAGQIDADGRVIVADATEASSTTDGSLQTAGGLSVVKSAVIGDDLDLLSDGAILSIGSTSKFALTDQGANNTVMASAGHRLAFGDAGEYISGDGTDLDIVSSGDLDITATLVDVTGAVTTSGRVQVNDTTEATSTVDGSLQTDGGLSVAKSAVIGDDLDLLSNAAVFKVGSDQPFTLTHANASNTLLASAGHRLAFGDAGEYISGDGTDLKIVSSGDVDITGDTDVTGAGTFSGILKTDNTTEATSTSDGALVTAGGLSVAKSAVIGDDLDLLSDGAIFAMGAGQDVTITHDGATGAAVASAGKFDITAGAASTIRTNAGDLTMDSNAGSILITAAEAAADAIKLEAESANGGIDLAVNNNVILSLDSNSVDIAQQLNVDATTDSTSASTGALVVDGGAGIAKDLFVGDDLSLISDGAVVNFGQASDISLTHIANDGLSLGGNLILNGGRDIKVSDSNQAALEIRDASANIYFNVNTQQNGVGTPDNVRLSAGSAGDIGLSHNGTDSELSNLNGIMTIKQTGAGPLILSASADNQELQFGDGYSGLGGMQGGMIALADATSDYTNFIANFSDSTSILAALNSVAAESGGGVVGKLIMSSTVQSSTTISLQGLTNQTGFSQEISLTKANPANTEVYVNGQLLMSGANAGAISGGGGDYFIHGAQKPGLLRFAFNLEPDDIVFVKTAGDQSS